MDLSAFVVEICQPNRTVKHLIEAVLVEAGARVVEAQYTQEIVDLLLCDADLEDHAMHQQRIERYEQAQKPVLMCGVRRFREPWHDSPWIERPFSASALLFQCGTLLNVDVSSATSSDTQTIDTREEPIRQIQPISEPTTREIALDEASLLEETFGLEPGVLGGDVDFSSVEDSDLNIVLVDDDEDMVIDQYEADALGDAEDYDDAFDELDNVMMGGKFVGQVSSKALDTAALAPIKLPQPAIRKPSPLDTTQPDLPLATRTESTIIIDDFEPIVSMEDTGSSPMPSLALPAVDKETSLELQNFARMLADAWLRIGLTARVQDRSDRINRVLHALFERGLEGAAQELQRVPFSEGFTGSLRSMSLVGLFRTIRDRKLRGCLEVSTTDNAYVLYLDRGTLIDVDELNGDNEQLLLSILHEHGALDYRTFQALLAEHAGPEFTAPVEMRLRMEGIVSEASIKQARTILAQRIFRRVCMARAGTFAFIEIRVGDGHAWPVRELRLNIDALLLEIMRETSVTTDVSEATSRAQLLPDPTRLAAIELQALNKDERELLKFFQNGGSIQQAREHLHYSDEEIYHIVNRLKRAELLKRTDPSKLTLSALKSEEMEAMRRSDNMRAVITPQDRTVITDVADSLNQRIRQTMEHDHPVIGSDGDDDSDRPTKSMKSHQVEPPEIGDIESSLLDKLIEEALQDGDEPLSMDDKETFHDE